MADETEVGNAVVAKAPSPGCAICTQIVEFFGTTVHGDKASLGLVSALIETPCPHGEWIKSFSAKANNLPGFAEGKMTIEKLGQSARLTFKVKEVPYHTELVRLVHRQEIARRYAGRGLILDSSWVNEALISLWKDLCHIHHGDACQHPARLQHVRASCPTWLIDTVEACLVPGREYISYVTLSYTRGDTTKLFNEKGILDQLQNPGILQAGILAERLSQTVRNAIDLVRLLGERYLWVDSLCIVQDDVEQVQTALDMMATIYKSSHFTIIAADGLDANYGLRGFENYTVRREAKQTIIPLQPPENLIVSESRTATDRINQHPYYSRAWTYQEYLCAKRRLVFENGLVYWECSRSRWSEEVIPDLSEPQNDYAFPFIHPESSPPLLFMDHAEWATTTGFLMDYDNTFTPSFPDMRCMNDIIKNYNTMLFTFPEDALPAFSGIQQVLSQIFPGGLLFGIPEFFFEIGLAWNPTSMAKRRCSTRGSRLESRLPSWSFLGWQVGAIFEDDLEFHESCCVAQEYVKGFSRPVTTWYTLDQPTSSTARKVESHWSRYRTRAQDHTKSLIGKWKRERFPVGVPRSSVGYRWYYDRDNLEAGQEYSYTHANYPGRFYKYPIPVLETNKTQPLSRQTQFLSCRTSRAFIRGVLPRGESASPTLQLARHNLTHIQLQDEEGNFTGFVTLMQEEDRERFANSTPAVIDLELVAIAEGWFGIMNFDACGKAANTRQQDFAHRECIHVLWVQWNDGVAYRKGNGSVTKEVWERIKEKELVDLVLG